MMPYEDWGTMEWLADDKTHAGLGLSLAKMTVLPNQTSPAHRHPNCNEVIHVVSGELEQRRDDIWTKAGPGDTLVIESGSVHQTRCLGTTPALMMIAYSADTRIYEEVAS